MPPLDIAPDMNVHMNKGEAYEEEARVNERERGEQKP
jgi:hypothetical protein